MAKLTGPLLSMGARGTVGKTLVIADWKGVKYARQHVIPANPRTTEQTVTRDTFSFINGFWLVCPTDGRAPWTANAVGQKYTDRNKLISENLPALRGQADTANFIGSPGALGGPPLESFAAVAGGSSGELDITVVTPTTPTGWTLASVTALAFPEQDPALPFGGPIAADNEAVAPYNITLTVLGSAVACTVTVWPVWTRPDGRTAYGPSLVDTATTAA